MINIQILRDVFITQDPARDGSNWYGYCGQNPTSKYDRIGLFAYDENGQQVSTIDKKSPANNPIYPPQVSMISTTRDLDNPTNRDSPEKGKRNKHNKSDKSNIEFPPGTKVTVETSGLDFNILTIFNLLSKGGLITIQGGFFDAKFTVDTGDGHVYNFTARYKYSVTQKDGCELTALVTSLTAGKATKFFNESVKIEDIAKDFVQAGTDSFGVGLSVVVGGSASGSYSGDWELGQFSLGGGFSIKGFPSLPVGTIWSHTETKLNENSIVEYGYDMWRPYEY